MNEDTPNVVIQHTVPKPRGPKRNVCQAHLRTSCTLWREQWATVVELWQ